MFPCASQAGWTTGGLLEGPEMGHGTVLGSVVVDVVTAGLRCVWVNWAATGRAFSDSSFSLPSQDLKKYGATTVVRVCEVTYDKTPLEKDGITVMVGGQQDGHQGGCPLPPPMLKYPQPSGLQKTSAFDRPKRHPHLPGSGV